MKELNLDETDEKNVETAANLTKANIKIREKKENGKTMAIEKEIEAQF